MAALFSILRVLHIAAGLTALATFIVPLVTRKGGKAHRRIGWVYVGGMATVAVSAVALSTLRLSGAVETDASRRPFAIFLMFIALLSSASAWFGLRALRQKKRTGRHSDVVDGGFSAALLAGAVATTLYGASIAVPLLTWFPTIGIFLGIRQLMYWLRAPTTSRHWWLEHMGGMFASCIATVTAFVVFGAPRLLDAASLPMVAWFAPTAVLVPILVVWQRYYRRLFASRTASEG